MAYDESITPTKFGPQAISATPTVDTVYSVPSNSRIILTCIDVCNTTAAPVTVRIYLVPSGGSPGTGNALFYDYSVPANDILQWTGQEVMHTGDSIRTSASATGLTAHFSGGVTV